MNESLDKDGFATMLLDLLGGRHAPWVGNQQQRLTYHDPLGLEAGEVVDLDYNHVVGSSNRLIQRLS